MAFYGYARVSTLDQDLTIQRAALKAAGCSIVRAEKASGSRRDGRTELQVLLDFVQPGDTLVVTRIDPGVFGGRVSSLSRDSSAAIRASCAAI
jgi:DNA invertase Pin-like site-specific DNA recombinase